MNFLFCGLGSIGQRHLRILRLTGDHNFTALRSGKSDSNAVRLADEEISDLKEITGSKKIDGAIISNPTSLHIETAIEIAKLGIPMFIEKPLGKDLQRIDELERLVKERNIPVLIGYNLLYHPCIESIKKHIAEGRIGKVISAKAQFGTYMPGWHKDEDYKKSYAANAAMGGGVVLTSIHEQNYLTYMFGEVTEVKAMETSGNTTGIDAEEGVEILMRHKSGVISNIHLNFFQKPYYRNCEVIGTEGTIYWDFKKPEVKILFNDKTETEESGTGYLDLLDLSYQKQMEHFMEIIRDRSVKPRADLLTGISDMRVALKILNEIGRN